MAFLGAFAPLPHAAAPFPSDRIESAGAQRTRNQVQGQSKSLNAACIFFPGFKKCSSQPVFQPSRTQCRAKGSRILLSKQEGGTRLSFSPGTATETFSALRLVDSSEQGTLLTQKGPQPSLQGRGWPGSLPCNGDGLWAELCSLLQGQEHAAETALLFHSITQTFHSQQPGGEEGE